MTLLIRLFGLLLVSFLLASGNVYADSDDEDDRLEILEDIGEFVGWGIVTLGVTAGAIFPLRRYSKAFLLRFSSFRDPYRNGLRWLTKLHPLIGLMAVGLGITHGLLMFIHEGELGGREWLGVLAVVLLTVAAGFGIYMYRNKKSIKRLRKYHVTILIIVAILAIIHIALD